MSSQEIPSSWRRQALQAWLQADPTAKVNAARAIKRSTSPCGADEPIGAPTLGPGRPPRPVLVAPSALTQRDVRQREGHAALLHALAHIEFNAIDLALDATWRFAGLPEAFYADWLQVAAEEALHFTLLREHLQTLGFDYGDFPAHNGLWEMAERTAGDVLARIALVPRTLEARGLDAAPPIRAKLAAIGDVRGAEILDLILRDEVGHVAVGNRWFAFLCRQRGLDPVPVYDELALRYRAPRLRGPFNLDARRQAGFSDAELSALAQPRG